MKVTVFSKLLLALTSVMLVSFTSASVAQSGAPAKTKYVELSPAQPSPAQPSPTQRSPTQHSSGPLGSLIVQSYTHGYSWQSYMHGCVYEGPN